MSGFAWVTLATNDSYSLGALVLAHSLRQVGTAHQLAILVTPGVTDVMRKSLAEVFNVVEEVNVFDSKDEANLRLLKRPELGVTFTKLHCWRLTKFEKCVFLDADVLVLVNSDELFEREEFSAAPDVGWPDCFNSGVFVYKPSLETYNKLVEFAVQRGSFDGGDQGLLNAFFSDWAHKDISKHLPFIYNMCSTACYSYLPAFKYYGGNVKIVHFIGPAKPWLQYFDTESRQVHPSPDLQHLKEVLQRWWDVFCSVIHPKLSPDMSGLAGAFAQFTLGVKRTPSQDALELHLRRQAWEVGNIDYMGKDSFDNIWSKICQTLSNTELEAAPVKDGAFSSVIQEGPVKTEESKPPAPEAPQPPITEQPAEPAPQDKVEEAKSTEVLPEISKAEEKPSETEKPLDAQKPAEVEIEKPAETEKLAEAEKPAEAEKLPEAQKPAEAEKPADAEKPAEVEKPAEAEKPAEIEKPVQAEEVPQVEKLVEVEKPLEAEKPAESEKPTEVTAEKPTEVIIEQPVETKQVSEVASEPEAPIETPKIAESESKRAAEIKEPEPPKEAIPQEVPPPKEEKIEPPKESIPQEVPPPKEEKIEPPKEAIPQEVPAPKEEKVEPPKEAIPEEAPPLKEEKVETTPAQPQITPEPAKEVPSSAEPPAESPKVEEKIPEAPKQSADILTETVEATAQKEAIPPPESPKVEELKAPKTELKESQKDEPKKVPKTESPKAEPKETLKTTKIESKESQKEKVEAKSSKEVKSEAKASTKEAKSETKAIPKEAKSETKASAKETKASPKEIKSEAKVSPKETKAEVKESPKVEAKESLEAVAKTDEPEVAAESSVPKSDPAPKVRKVKKIKKVVKSGESSEGKK